MRIKNRDHILFLSAALCILWIAAFSVLLTQVSRNSETEQRTALEAALERDITGCYALEGAYPPDLDYLRQHYGLTWDERLFYVDYRPVASNIRPYYIIISLTDRDNSGNSFSGRDAGGSL